MLSDREAQQFLREVDEAKQRGLKLTSVARTLGYGNPNSFATALQRGRIPRDVAERFRAVVRTGRDRNDPGTAERVERAAAAVAPSPSAPPGRSTPGTAVTLVDAPLIPLSTIHGPADRERRKVFVGHLEQAREHLARAHDALTATIASGAATLVTEPGIKRLLEMLQHLREELAAT